VPAAFPLEEMDMTSKKATVNDTQMTMKMTTELVKTLNFETSISFMISLLDFFSIHTYDSVLLFFL
jgi:hypothetical protein